MKRKLQRAWFCGRTGCLRRRWGVALASFLVVLLPAAVRAMAEQMHLDFVHRLQERGYGELAVQYLSKFAQGGEDLPEELREVWQLELGKSLRISAGEAANTDQAQKRLADALTHIDAFLKEHATHPSAGEALGTLGDIATQRGQLLIRTARLTADAARQAEYYASARAALEEAKPRFAQAVDRYYSNLRELIPAAPEPKKDANKKAAQKTITKRAPRPTSRAAREAAAERQDAELNWLEARLKLALTDYFIAQTFTNPDDATRKKALQDAAAGFDAIFQQYRTFEIGLYAHMWEGKARDDMGDLRTAEAIYDEVLVNAPEGTQPQAPTGLEPLFAQVEMFRLQLLLKKGDVAVFTDEAANWLRLHQSSRRTAGYQGIALELAKAQLAQAEKLQGEERHRLFTLALRALTEVTKVPSEYQQDAFILRRKYQEEVKGSTAEIVSYDEGLSVGNAAARSGQWEEAVAAYARAADYAAKDKDPERSIDARYRLAHAQLMAGKVAEAADTAEDIARKNLASRTAPQAAALATSAALALYTHAQDKAPALDRLMKMANYTIDHWPDRPEADDARIALGQANVVRGDTDAAIAVFEQVKPDSERYPSALYSAAQAYWRNYLSDRQNSRLRDRAMERLDTSLQLQMKQQKPGEPMDRQLIDTQLLMAEMKLEGNQPDQAIPLIDPLIEAVRSARPESLDTTTLRILVAGLRANIALDNLAKAGEIQSIVVQIGGDSPPVNAVLVEFAKLISGEVRRADAAVAEAKERSDSKALELAQASQKGARDVLSQLLDQLVQRQHHSVASLIYMADSYARIDAPEKARAQYQRTLKAIEEEPGAGGGPAVTRVRAQLVGLLREEGKYEEAMQQVEQLIRANPRDLAPLMEKGRILQAWADKEPKYYNDAVVHWSGLRNILARMQRKPPEYYEVVYNAAACLMEQAKPAQDKSKALQAEQLLKSTLVLSPNLSGPEMAARYNDLLQQAIKLQGR